MMYQEFASRRLRRTTALCAVLSVLAPSGFAAAAGGPDAAAKDDIESIVVNSSVGKDGAGLIKDLEQPKSASSVSRDFIDDQPAAASPLQLINLAPGVNSNGRDPTGLGRSAISVRGFQSNQIGLILDGVPVNDSGTFNVYSMEYIDAENLSQVYIQQGSGDADTPNVGETGGNIGMVILRPSDEFHVTAVEGGGQNSFLREFIRVDSGKLAGNNEGFISYSNARSDLWRGAGTTERQHVDAQIAHDFSADSRIALSAFYNTAETYSYQGLTKAQIAQYGYDFNYAQSFQPTVPATATTPENDNNSGAVGLNQRSNYYKLVSNPFENLVVSVKANLALTQDIRVDLQPYLWYGFGAGGTGAYISEGNTALLGAATDLNKNGNTKDNLLYYNPFAQQQVRPGMMSRVRWTQGDNELVAGIQLEDGELREWKPLLAINPVTGAPVNLWPYTSNETVHRADGSLARTQDQNTDTKIVRPFLVDTLTLFDNLLLTAGIQHSDVNRDGTNYLTLAQRTVGNAVAPTNPHLDEAQWVPSFGAVYHITDQNQLFFSVQKTFRANDNVPLYTAGVDLATIKPETTVDYELGTRYSGDSVVASATLFNTDYANREQSLFDASALTTVTKNIGSVTIRGAELEAGTQPIHNVSFYVSGSYTQSQIDNNISIGLPNGTLSYLPTAGKQLTDTPKFITSALIRYATDDYFAQLQGKVTSSRFATLMNDERVPAFGTLDAAIGIKVPDLGGTHVKSKLELSVTNLLDTRYFGGINFGNNSYSYNGIAPNLPTYEVGAPRFVSAKLTVTY
jgi:iron complex outermembrane receptor protein